MLSRNCNKYNAGYWHHFDWLLFSQDRIYSSLSLLQYPVTILYKIQEDRKLRVVNMMRIILQAQAENYS